MLQKIISTSFIFIFTVASLNAAVVAKIGKKEITQAEFDLRYQQNVDLAPPNAKPSKKEVLENLVNFELAIEKAKESGLDKSTDLKEQFDILLYQELVRREIQPKINNLKISSSDVKSYYNDNPLVKTKHIVLLITPEMTEAKVKAVKARAEKVLKEVQSGKNFEELVSKYSEGPSARTGGEVSWAARDKLLPEYYEAALRIGTPGKTSGLVFTPYGFHIIKLDGIKKYSEFKSQDKSYNDFIVRTLKEIKGKSVYQEYFSNLKKSIPVKVNL